MRRVFFAIISALVFLDCTAAPKWYGKLYAGDSKNTQIIYKDKSGKEIIIKCDDIKFDDYLCMSYLDFKLFYETYILGCKEWKKTKKSDQE